MDDKWDKFDPFKFQVARNLIAMEKESLKLILNKNYDVPVNQRRSTLSSFDEKMSNICKTQIEIIEIEEDEISCLEALEEFLKVVERGNMKTIMKSKWLKDENTWMKVQINDFQLKLTELQREWLKLEIEWNYKLYFYKMRHLQTSVEFIDKIDSLDIISVDESDNYEPDDYFTGEIRPICNIIKEHMLNWKNDLAISWSRDVLIVYREKQGDYNNNVRDLYAFLGKLYCANKQYTKAELCFTRALAIHDKLEGNENVKGYILTLLGITFYKEQNIVEAEKHLKRALVCREFLIGQFHPDIIDIYSRLGNIYNKLGMWEQSISSCNSSLHSLEHMFEDDDPQIMKCYLVLIDNYCELDMQEKAHLCLQRISTFSISPTLPRQDLASPFSFVLGKPSDEIKEENGLSLLMIYGKIQKCYSGRVIKAIIKYLLNFKYTDALQLIIEWCELSHFPYKSVSYVCKRLEKPIKQDSTIGLIKRTESLDSLASGKSQILKDFKNKLKGSFKAIKKQF